MDIHDDEGPSKRGFCELPLPASFRTGMGQNIIVGFVCFCCPGMFNAMQVCHTDGKPIAIGITRYGIAKVAEVCRVSAYESSCRVFR